MEESSIAIYYCRMRLSARGQMLLALYVEPLHAPQGSMEVT